MSRYEISDHGSKLTVRDTKYGSEVSMLRVRSYSRELTVMAGAIRQQQADIAALKDVLAGEVEANEAFRKAGGALDGEDMPKFCARIIAERDQLRDADAFSRKELARGNEIIDSLRVERDQLRARLAAIDAAPTVAWMDIVDGEELPMIMFSRKVVESLGAEAQLELIARPAKDGGA